MKVKSIRNCFTNNYIWFFFPNDLSLSESHLSLNSITWLFDYQYIRWHNSFFIANILMRARSFFIAKIYCEHPKRHNSLASILSTPRAKNHLEDNQLLASIYKGLNVLSECNSRKIHSFSKNSQVSYEH